MTMRRPAMRATIERRLLVNYRVDPNTLRRALPEPFRLWLVNDAAVAGICLIRLRRLRPAGLPAWVGLTTENAAHRIAVEWDAPDGVRRGVYIPRRDTSSRLTSLVGGRLFPGAHHRASFRVQDDGTGCDVAFASDDGFGVAVSTRATDDVPRDSVFGSLGDASTFFRAGSLGYSATRGGAQADGLELSCDAWNLSPVAIEHVESSFFDDVATFPWGSAVVDSAFVMRDLDTTWRAREPLPLNAAPDATLASSAR
jgi:hypothetical protein